jgi:hypothetical protein
MASGGPLHPSTLAHRTIPSRRHFWFQSRTVVLVPVTAIPDLWKLCSSFRFSYTPCRRSAAQAISSASTTTSTCTVVSAQGTHLFHITGYSLHQIFCAGTSVRSAPFSESPSAATTGLSGSSRRRRRRRAGASPRAPDQEPRCRGESVLRLHRKLGTVRAPWELVHEDRKGMFRNLFVPADHYEVKRLKLMCEDNLCRALLAGILSPLPGHLQRNTIYVS